MSDSGRIVSLLPSTTEILHFINVGSRVVGVTHECDYPPSVGALPSVTRSLLPPHLTSAEIDTAVAASMASDAHTIYQLDVDKLRELSPDIIVTQKLCDVCAVPERNVKSVACAMPSECQVISADPSTLNELFDCIRRIGKAVGAKDVDGQATALEKRLRIIENLTSNTLRPRVCVLEWPAPPYAPGHWVPDQIEAAGGICAIGMSGAKSSRVTWNEIIKCNADVIVCAFCGYNLTENQKHLQEIGHVPEWRVVSSKARVFATDASAYFSRPGPRLIDGVEILAYALHRGDINNLKKPDRGQISELVNGNWVDGADFDREDQHLSMNCD